VRCSYLRIIIRLQQARQHANEGGLAGPVLAQHHDDLAVCELAGVDLHESNSTVGLAVT